MSKRILSVNGNKAMNYLLQTIFKKEYELMPVTDVFHAMYHLKTDSDIELIIVDVDYESKKSWELIQHIKTSRMFSVPVVVLATANTDLIEKNCYEYNIDDTFFKPFNPADLVNAVKATVSNNVLTHA